MRTTALLAQEPETKELLLLAADRIEELKQWKLLWATTHEELEQARNELAAHRLIRGEVKCK
jgi:hypothetical protein